MICGLFQNQASTSGTLLSNTIPNPNGEMKAITSRSGVAYERPSIPTNSSPKKTFTKTTPIPESDIPKSFPKPNIPYPSRHDDQKSRDKASNQMEKIFQIFQDLHFDISFADALLLMPRFAPTIKSLLMNKEKLLELAKIPLNENCSAMLLKKLSEKLGDPDKFLIPCNFQEWIHALIDVYKGELVLRDENEQITFHVNGTPKHPQKHINELIKMVNNSCKDSFKRFTDEPALVYSPPPEDVNDEKEKQEVKNLAEPTAKCQTRITPCLKNFKVICKESIFHSNKLRQVSLVFAITSTLPSIKPEDSLIMGDEHLNTFSDEKIVPIPREYEDTSRSNSRNDLPLYDDLSSINVPRDDFVTFSNPLFEFDVNFKSSDINPLFNEVLEDIECKDSDDSNLDESTFLFTPLSDSNKDECLTPRDEIEILYDALIDEAKCFDPGGDNDEIDAFLAIEVPTYIEEGYYDSEGDVLYLESLLNDDNTHNFSSNVFFDHEQQHIENESDHVTFSPKSDPLHHEFTGELITIPPGIIREHEDYINRMSLLCGNSSSQSPENSHTIIESLPTSTTLIEDSDSNREEIDIFSGPDDSIPPAIESDFNSKEDIIDNLLNDDPIPEYERLTFDMEPNVPVINNVDELNEDECFDPGGGEINVEIEDSFTFVTRTFLPYLTYPEVSPLLSSTKNEDTIFDPSISTKSRWHLIGMELSCA
ncbi:hypothetical protein Tco_0952815 [Tanacetum coccineum]|uniref:Reverse transcriptase domain-containing protein n=1 Tax=Tanacetum coccineum TaxID=301880 RepID=A0ABQ5DY42_9ASTR